MKLNETRESAHLRSRVTDLSVVPNLVSYNALLACITPLASQNVERSEEDNEVYKPMLIRDVDTLISNFGDPRIDPKKYVDLYAIMRMINNGGTCYLAKVHSGNGGKYLLSFNKDFNATQDPSDPGTTDPGTTDPGTTVDNKYEITTITTPGVNKDWNISVVEGSDGKVWQTHGPISGEDIGDSIIGAKLVSKDGSSVTPLTIVANDPADDQIKIEPNPFNTASPYNKGITSPLKFTFSEPIDFNKNHTLLLEVPTARRFETVISEDKNSLLFGTDNTFMPDDYELIYIVASDNQTSIDVSKVKTISKLETHEKERYYKITFDTSVTLDDEKYNTCNIAFYKKSATATGAKKSHLRAAADPDAAPKDDTSDEDKVSPITIIASSALDSEVEITYHIASLTPTGIKTVCLFVEAKKKDDGFKLGSARVVLTPTLTNGEIISALNSKLGTYIHFELYENDQQYADCALSSVDDRDQHSIVKILNCGAKEKFFVKNTTTGIFEAQDVKIESKDIVAKQDSKATFSVSLENYRKALDQYKDKRYNGCILADMTSKVTEGDTTEGTQTLKPMSADELRTLHYYLKGIAAERKDCTVLLSTPEDVKTISAACDFALSQASDSTKWEYGETPTTDYTLQSFYLEMYYPWLKIKCTKLGSTTPVSVNETIAPTAIVLDNILKSYRERGVHYPVAGDQYGQLSDTFSVINNPKTKFDRDQLVRARINPIWDTGKRGIQIYGNETLNAGYTDLNAAHIARTLVYIRNKIDEYTETLKFNINSVILWNRWKSYVSDYILEPLKSENALSDYEVMMGEDTTTREEIANRMLKGKIKLIFYQSAEIFDLDYIVYSSSNVTIADAEAQI